MPKLFAKRRSIPAAPLLCSLLSDHVDSTDTAGPPDPEAQVELVCQAIQKLAQVRQMVGALPELPAGNRQEMLAQLAVTLEDLRALAFLDAIY